MKIVMLDSYTVNPGDISWKPIKDICQLVTYDYSNEDEIIPRIQDADGIMVNKTNITEKIMRACPKLKLITVTATGYNNIDIESAKKHGIAVCNVPGYSTEAVAQQTFAMILELTNKVAEHNNSVMRGDWGKCQYFSYNTSPISLLSGKTLGIIGYGNIGKKVGKIAEAFGMKVVPYNKNKKLCMEADILTLHCPLTKENKGMINKDFISKMKNGAIIINTARGGLIDTEDLANALNSGKISGAAIDVLTEEPPIHGSPLIGAKNCIITPHVSWSPLESRIKLIELTAKNIMGFINGKNINRII